MSDATTNASSAITPEHINRFQKRAKVHFLISYLIIVFIVVLFFMAGYVFWYAQDIDRSTGSIELLQEVELAKKNESIVIDSLEAELDGLRQESEVGQRTTADVVGAMMALGEAKIKLLIFEQKERLMTDVGYFSDVDTVRSKEELIAEEKGMTDLLDKFDHYLKETQERFKVGEVTATDVHQVTSYINEENLKKSVVEQRIKAAPQAEKITKTATAVDTLDLIRTNLIRFGGVAVTFFLISVLIPIYRYNVRLATFYLARADTLTICRDVRIDNFKEMIDLLTPTDAFEKEPSTPVETVISLLREAAPLAKKI